MTSFVVLMHVQGAINEFPLLFNAGNTFVSKKVDNKKKKKLKKVEDKMLGWGRFLC